MSRSKELAQRRSMLIAQCTLQRTMLLAQSRALGTNTGWFKSGEGIIARLKHMPGWANIVLAAVTALIPGRTARLIRSGLILWQLWRNLKTAGESTAAGEL